MVTHVTISYPAEAKLDMDYYLKSHMPLVYKSYSSQGLQGYKVLRFPDDGKNKYGVQAILIWESLDRFKAAGATPEGQKVHADIPNFTDGPPDVAWAEVIDSR